MKIKTIFILLSLASSFWAKASLPLSIPDVIYGEDRRQDVINIPLDSPISNWSKSLAALVSTSQLSPYISSVSGMTLIQGQSLWDKIQLCSNERFAKEISIAKCSAFLIGEDIAVTAGHCLFTNSDCQKSALVFDLTSNLPRKNQTMLVKNKQVFRCQKIIDSGLKHQKEWDYTVFRLDHKVEDRPWLDLDDSGGGNSGELEASSLLALGFPMGVPLKIDMDASFVPLQEGESDLLPYAFRTDLDMFKGNSGSPIISKHSGKVVGMQLRGAEDFIYDPLAKCKRSHVCKEVGVDEDCDGELALRSKIILQAIKKD